MVVNRLSTEVLAQIPTLLPGIEQVVLIQTDHACTAFTGVLLKKREDSYCTEPIKIESGSEFFAKQMQGTLHYQWVQKNQIPFDIISNVKVQLTIFSELKNSILMIIVRHSGSDLSDLHFLYFNENLSNFLIDKVSEQFSAQHKNMVGFLLYHSIKALYSIYYQQEQLVLTFNDQVQAIIKERNSLKEEIGRISGKERQDVLRMAQHYLEKISGELGKSATLTDSAKTRLRDFKGDLFELEAVMREAIAFAGALSFSSGTSPILLADYHIRFPDPAMQKVQHDIDGLPQRYIKTHLLLDRLELAASGLKQRRVPLTSAKVGKEFPTPVSAPAITDALRKHKKRIVSLFEQYPKKWEIIRHEFRPIQNLFSALPETEQLSA
ncbi:MAG: hypothetical protein V1733_11135 [bacterium]